jgi:hypothetical protein
MMVRASGALQPLRWSARNIIRSRLAFPMVGLADCYMFRCRPPGRCGGSSHGRHASTMLRWRRLMPVLILSENKQVGARHVRFNHSHRRLSVRSSSL